MFSNQASLRSSAGFTIVELIVVVTVTSLLIGVLFGPLNDIYMSNSRDITTVTRVTDTRGALNSIEHNITLATKFLHQNTITDPGGTTWDWRGPTNNANDRVLITSNYATTIDEGVDTTGSRMLVTGSGCSTPAENNYVYFVRNKTLYRRTIVNAALPCAASIGQRQTCTPGSCARADAKIVSGVTVFKVDYFDSSNTSIPTDQYTNYTVPDNAKTIIVTLTVETGVGTQRKSTTGKIRITRINGLTS